MLRASESQWLLHQLTLAALSMHSLASSRSHMLYYPDGHSDPLLNVLGGLGMYYHEGALFSLSEKSTLNQVGSPYPGHDQIFPKTKKSKRSNPEVLRLTQVMMDYYVLIENCSARIRYFPDLYKILRGCTREVHEKPPLWTRQGRAGKKEVFFSSVDEICKTEPSTPEEYVLNSWLSEYVKTFQSCFMIMFAATGALQVIIEQDLSKMTEPERCQVENDSARLVLAVGSSSLLVSSASDPQQSIQHSICE